MFLLIPYLFLCEKLFNFLQELEIYPVAYIATTHLLDLNIPVMIATQNMPTCLCLSSHR
jgi:hypothetical protein